MELGEEVGSPADPTNRSSPLELETQNEQLKEVEEEMKENPARLSDITIIFERSSCSEQDNCSVCSSNPKIIRPRKKVLIPIPSHNSLILLLPFLVVLRCQQMLN